MPLAGAGRCSQQVGALQINADQRRGLLVTDATKSSLVSMMGCKIL